MTTNLFVLPRLGESILPHDTGLYYILNQQTGRVRSLIQLVRENMHWYLMQLQPIADGLDYRWSVLSRDTAYALQPASDKQIAHYFAKPEYAEPSGAWQVLRNSDFGFGKFTPMGAPQAVSFAILTFDGEDMHPPIRLHRAPEDWLQADCDTDILSLQMA